MIILKHHIYQLFFGTLACLFILSGTGLTACTCEQRYVIPAGKTTQVTSHLTIQDVRKVGIAGNLVASGDNGQSITIKANGDITISGKLIAGNGGEGQDGGTLTIISQNGNIYIGDTASLKAGDGRSGQNSIGEEGAGTRGGSVIFKAPNGTITFPDAEGIIHIGNGGNGADINIHGDDLLTTELPEQLSNAGGDSGELLVEASQLIGLTYEVITLTEDIVDPETGETIIPAGLTFRNIESDKQLITGGVGGDAGSLYYGVDEEGNSTYPELLTANPHTRLVDWQPTRYAFAAEQEAGDETLEKIRVRGAWGGNGERKGGNGGNVRVRGRNGVTLSNGNGQAGQAVDAWGGSGGSCQTRSGNKPCNGGNAFAFGGNGGHGVAPCGNGGEGSQAWATGGTSGALYSFRRVLAGITIDTYLGAGGDAHARGGDGGNAGGTCPDNVCGKGGDGGNAGQGGASPGEGEPDGSSYVTGGDGGDGGDGRYVAGKGGFSGIAQAFRNVKVRQRGEAGNPGATCVPLEEVLSVGFWPYCIETEAGLVLELDLAAIDLTGGKALIRELRITIDGVSAYYSGRISATRFPADGKRLRGQISPGKHTVTAVAINEHGQRVEYTQEVVCHGLIIDQPPTPGPETPTPGPVCPTCGNPVDQCTCPK